MAADNPFLALETVVAEHIEQSLNLFRDVRDAMLEVTFHAIYGSPWLRLLGTHGLDARADAKAENLLMLPDVRAALDNIEVGSEVQATVRMLELLSQVRGYARRSRLEREVELFASEEPFRSMSEAERAHMIHEQSLIVQFAPNKAKASLPRLLDTAEERSRALDLVMRIAGPAETMHPQALALYREFEAMLARPLGGEPVAADGWSGRRSA